MNDASIPAARRPEESELTLDDIENEAVIDSEIAARQKKNERGKKQYQKRGTRPHDKRPPMKVSSDTMAKMKKFIIALRRYGVVSYACEESGLTRQKALILRKHRPKFAQLWEEALEMAVDRLEQGAMTRSIEGVNNPVYQGGKLVGYKVEYSDGLTQFLLRGQRPERYRDRSEIEAGITFRGSERELDSAIEQALARLASRGEAGASMEAQG